MTKKHILFKIASRERPIKLVAAIDNIIHFCDDKENFSIMVSLDEDDHELPKMFPNMEAISNFKKRYPMVYLHFGFSKNKIDAINRDINKHNINWHILVNFSDDMLWCVQGFDNRIREAFEENGYNNFLHIHDQHEYNNVIAAMSIMGREYYEKFGYIYNPGYKSFFCDNEAFDVAKMKGEYIEIKDVLFHHIHPMWSEGVTVDSLYKKNNAHWLHDQKVYGERKGNNFTETLKKINQ